MVTARADSRRERHRIRETALQLLYQWEVAAIAMGEADDADDALALFWSTHPAPKTRQAGALRLARGTVGALPTIDPLIESHAEHWRPERMAVIDRLIMRLAIYEMLVERMPPAVAIDEALELARTFSGEEAVRFINGVLDAIRRDAVGAVTVEDAADSE
ncbi:MAG: transcription antitermination factor NusB [Acidobacteria bacterium]|nr:transcription antitermination factor NusB [Acidobacteriota bacterium]MYJ03326.1 transcription antitermination factor NusB [Acidobacteriota bacterium]